MAADDLKATMTHRRLGGIGRRDDRGALKGRVSRPVPRTRGVGGTLAPPLTGGAAGPMFLRTSPYPPRTFLKTDRVTAFRPARTGARPRPRSCRRRREDPSQHRPRSRALEEGVGGDVHRGEAHPVDAYGPRAASGTIEPDGFERGRETRYGNPWRSQRHGVAPCLRRCRGQGVS